MDLSEIKTITQAKQGDKLALLALYNQYLPLFKKLCRNRADYSNVLEVDDLLQECFLALESATNSYSFEREASFKTYLYSCVKWHLTRVIAKHSNVTENQLTLILQIKKFRENYEKQHGRMPDNALAKFVLAVRRNYSDEVSFIPVKAFAKKAEFARDYLMQGTKVMVEGEIVTGNYEDKDTGKKIYTTEVYANRIEFAGAKMVDRPPFPEDAEGFLEIPEGMEEEMPFR
ncbi:single-stranded DNA-binding protein [Coprococcus comes]|nr:single-stranded DNA-binding protein [Coprococcus comes]